MDCSLTSSIWVLYLRDQRGLSLAQITSLEVPLFLLIVFAESPDRRGGGPLRPPGLAPGRERGPRHRRAGVFDGGELSDHPAREPGVGAGVHVSLGRRRGPAL